MKIVHCSDWHGKLRKLPPADLYVVTGDMMDTYPIRVYQDRFGNKFEWNKYAVPKPRKVRRRDGTCVDRRIDPEQERKLQIQWAMTNPFRPGTGIDPNVPVVVCRGNHDFVDLSQWIGGEVFEVSLDPTKSAEYLGLRFGGVRGIRFMEGEWSDEMRPGEFEALAEKLPLDLDVLVSHSPPAGVRDQEDGVHWGQPSLNSYWQRKNYGGFPPLKLHCYGHVHDARGKTELGGTIFSNAATTFHEITL